MMLLYTNKNHLSSVLILILQKTFIYRHYFQDVSENVL